MREATLEEVKALSQTELAELIENLQAQDVQMDPETFQPFKEFDGLRYTIEAIEDIPNK